MSFCPNCGNEVQEGYNFCSKCGKSLEMNMSSTVGQKNAYSMVNNNVAEKKKAKKKAPIWLVIIIFVGAAALGRLASSALLSDDDDSESYTSGEGILEDEFSDIDEVNLEDAVEIANPEYLNVFTERGLDTTDLLDTSEYSVERFVLVDEEGMVDRLEYGYEDDTIEISAETIYYPLAGFTEDQKAQFDLNMKEAFAAAEALDFSEIVYEIGDEYYTIIVVLDDLDEMMNIQAAIDAGVIQVEGSAISLSMEKTTDGLLAAGYIQK